MQANMDYAQNSNLVLTAERDIRRRGDEATGEVESLWGKLGTTKMGDRVHYGRPQELTDRLERVRKKKQKRLLEEGDDDNSSSRKKADGGGNIFTAGQGASVLTESHTYSEMLSSSAVGRSGGVVASGYVPKTRESKQAYEEILNFVQGYLGDQPQDVLRGAAEEVLSIMKEEDGTVIGQGSKQREVEKMLFSGGGRMAGDRFNTLVNLGKRIHDFSINADEEGGKKKDEGDDDDDVIDDEVGVAVLIDDDDDDGEDDEMNEIQEDGDDDGDDEGGVEAKSGGKLLKGGDMEGDDDGAGDEEDVVAVSAIDAFWLQRGLGKYFDDADISAKLAEDVLGILQLADERECENKLVVLLDYDKFDFIKVLMKNRKKIVYCTRFKQAQSDEDKAQIEAEMVADVEGGGPAILDAIKLTDTAETWQKTREQRFAEKTRREAKKLGKDMAELAGDDPMTGSEVMPADKDKKGGVRPEQNVDLEALSFHQGGHTMTNSKCELPEKSWRAVKKGYEEVHVPAVKSMPGKDERLIPIEEMPEWTHKAFKGMTTLNRIQSKMYETALQTSHNLLLCAPTGAGKTNVAMLTMLHQIGLHRNEDGSIDKDAFKIVYVAPMKALVAEVVKNFSQRLESYGIQVKELSGDQSLTKAEIAETQVIVTTPEKWDIITRKSGDRTYTQLVKLLIIDEIHLLHDDRGPVLEAIVARTIRQVEVTQEMIRMVGLSATLPNYEDVATFLRVQPDKGLFYFDNSFRPVPLQQQYIGVTEKKAIKRFNLMNEICYQRVTEQAGKNQVLIFAHSRKETGKTAKALRDLAEENDELGLFVAEESATKEILMTEAETAKNQDLKDVLPFGFAIHHAGMTRADRNLVEDLFADGHIQVLVSTATLAWGVNLPAHTVIIKGTKIYNPEKGRWCELSPLDIMQMLGRAGRPQFDSQGEGIILTEHSELQYYLSLMNHQLPIESQMVGKLADQLNAEIVLGTIQNIEEGVNWLGYTYLYVRMLRNPTAYGCTNIEDDPTLEQRRADLIHSAGNILDRSNLVKYDRKSGNFQATSLGIVAAHYYITHHSMATYNEYLKPTLSDIELFRLFSLSYEFRHIIVREEEKLELKSLLDKVPIPIKESMDEPSAKINVLLQSYISGLKLEGFALVSDMTYIQQSASRILRALFEVALKRGWAALADRTLTLCKMVDKRIWLSQTPLRQFRGIPEMLLKKLEKINIGWDRYYDLKPADIGELVMLPKMGKLLHKFIHQFPRIELAAHVLPISRTMMKVELTISADFQFDDQVHGNNQSFWVLVEDVDGESILHHEFFVLKQRYADDDHVVEFTIPIFDPLPPSYFVRVVSDRWLHSEASLPISFQHLILPQRYPPHTELLDLQPLPVTALKDPLAEALYSHKFHHFNAIQTQCFQQLYESDDNVMIAAPTGSGKTICAEFAMLRLFAMSDPANKSRCVYIAPLQDICDETFAGWSKKFGKDGYGLAIAQLTGETQADLKILEASDIIITTAEKWDVISRRWKQRKNVQSVALYIVDELHLIGASQGPVLEVVVSRIRYIAGQVARKARIIGLSTSVANAKDVGDWIGAPNHSQYNFLPSVRPVPLELHLQGFDINHFGSRMLAMAKPVYNAVSRHTSKKNSKGKPAIVFVPSRKQTTLTAVDLITFAAADGNPNLFVADEDEMEEMKEAIANIRDATLQQAAASGVVYCHAAMRPADQQIAKLLFSKGAAQVMVTTHDQCWGLGLFAHLVVVMGTQSYDGREHRYVDYPVSNVLQMMGRANRPLQDDSGTCVILCHTPKKDYFMKFLHEPLPIESHLNYVLHDHINAETVTKTIENKQDAVDYITWTFFYRRLSQNPNYYNLEGVSHRHLSDHLSQLVETIITDLEESRCLQVEDDYEVSALNLGMISAYYYTKYTTIELFASSLTAKTKLAGLVEILSSASEYGEIQVRSQEDRLLQQLAKFLPQKLDSPKYNDPHVKTNILMQCHFSRKPLASDLKQDKDFIIGESIRLLQAIVDVISSNGWLKPALAAMELSQMITQALWFRDSSLLQIPYFTKDLVKKIEDSEHDIESVFDIIDLEDKDRNDLLQFSKQQMSEVVRFCNSYPNVDVNYEIQDKEEIKTGGTIEVVVQLERVVDDEDDVPAASSSTETDVYAPFFPKQKCEGWWLVIGDPKTNNLLSIKRVNLQRKSRVKLDFPSPEEVGDKKYILYFMCDSYLGCDQEFELEVAVAQGEDDSDDDDDDDSSSSSEDDN
jgi:pre-mRNA-splicing helicase BRR2